ncbi:hypothetical protein [Thiocapsa marina]|uniref:Uncharacterized protein n=1 Tax=Thiocapsa marina 5811 TaxID=768671 RepID=F9UDQ2_9GAMM|nr:hypothetical protein [Thiocapsa marina]EGV17699.1 hypothetical protein ThimaDRAFT_3244 [Thiocapsa marina 5811]
MTDLRLLGAAALAALIAGTGAARSDSVLERPTDLRILAAPVSVEAIVEAVPLVPDVERIGMNLGHSTYWGAEQLPRNILRNPGFEGIIDRALVRVAYADQDRFSDDQTWLAREDGFWSGATYEILTGAAAGASGTLVDSRAVGSRALPELITDGLDDRLAPGDIVALTRIRDDLPPSHWWLPDSTNGQVQVDPARIAPDSPGRRSLALTPLSGATLRLASHLDTIGTRAGKLLPVEGPWLFSLWIHAETGDPPRVRIFFRRHGSGAFLDVTLRPEPGWQRIEHTFDAVDAGPIGALELAIEVTGPGQVHLDDVWLGPIATEDETATESGGPAIPGVNAFRPEVIAALQQLRPGYLRDWQNQLGDTLDNRLAVPHARRASRYRPGNGAEFSYSLPEFFDLSRSVGANPWLVMPTTFTTDEARRLGAWLAERIETDGFSEVLVEFGNENWNSIFRPAGIQDPAHHGAAADRLFTALEDGAGNHPALRRVVNAQHANPYAAGKVAAASTKADILAVAPYMLSRLDAVDGDRALELLFEDDGGRLEEITGRQPAEQELAVYEVNLHTTRGDIAADDRAAIVTGAASGPALAKRLLEAMALGARRQCVYTLAGFDTRLEGNAGLVPLFGVTRDLTRSDRLRPTGWAIALLNQVIGGDLHRASMTEEDTGLHVATFRGAQGWSVAIVSDAPEPRRLTLRFPDTQSPRPTGGYVLDASEPFKGNETVDEVRPQPLAVRSLGKTRIRVTVPAYSLVVLGPAEVLP